MTAQKSINILFIIGPTSSGKTALALSLSKKYPFDLISADSRQVYKGLDIITGKDIPKGFKYDHGCYTNGKTNIYGIDLVSLNQDWNVSLFKNYALQAVKKISSHHRLPIVVGGTGLYLSSLLNNHQFHQTPPNQKLRQRLSNLSLEELQKKLKKINPLRYHKLNHSDLNNPRRLIRAIEISVVNQKPQKYTAEISINPIILGLNINKKTLKDKILTRVQKRLKAPRLLSEVKKLDSIRSTVNQASTTLGYNEYKLFQAQRITKEELVKLWLTHELQYAKRQMTWFQKMPNIIWFDAEDPNLSKKVASLLKPILKTNNL